MSVLFRLLSLICFVASILLGVGLVAGLSGGRMATLDIAIAALILLVCIGCIFLFNRLARRYKAAS